MAEHELDDAETRERLWKEIKDVRFGMLGVVGSHEHFRPMVVYPDKEASTLWFFTRKDTEIARSAQDADTEAMFIVQARDQELQACIGGRLLQDGSRTMIDRYWNPAAAAWYPKGKDDPYLTMLKLEGRSASVWISEGDQAKRQIEIAKSTLTGDRPNLSRHLELPLGGGGLRA
jgi:general stress protein 26